MRPDLRHELPLVDEHRLLRSRDGECEVDVGTGGSGLVGSVELHGRRGEILGGGGLATGMRAGEHDSGYFGEQVAQRFVDQSGQVGHGTSAIFGDAELRGSRAHPSAVNNDTHPEGTTAMIQLTAPTSTTLTTTATPGAVTGARIVAIAQGFVIVALGSQLVWLPGGAVLGAVAIVEGVARMALGLYLRRGARRTRKALVVLASVGMFASALMGGMGYIGAAINGIIVRLLVREDSKEFLGA